MNDEPENGSAKMHREELLEKLVSTSHLNVPDRKALGLASVPTSEIAVILKRLLEHNGVFPMTARVWKPGELVFEGFFLLKKPEGGVRLCCQRAHPIRPTVLADQKSWEYDNVDDAISSFIRSEWSSGIDGIKLS